MKILILDIETSPMLCYTWGLWKQNINLDMVVQDIKIMSYAAKWVGEDTTFYVSTQFDSEMELLRRLNMMLDDADIVVGHNLSGFDMKHVRGRTLVYKLPIPSPYREIDTLKTAKGQFKFASNKLSELARVLRVSAKSKHEMFPGATLWMECLKGNDSAWVEMMIYNMQDVVTTEAVYLAMRPYMKTHPNLAVYSDLGLVVCPKCGSEDTVRRGYTYTNGGKYQRYRCKSCGGWHRSRRTELSKEDNATLSANLI